MIGRTIFQVQPVSLMVTWTDLMPFFGRTISDLSTSMRVQVKTTSRARGKSSSYSIDSFLSRPGGPRTSSRLIALDRKTKKSVPMVSRDLSRTLPLTVPARGSALRVSVLLLVKMTGAHLTP